MRTDEPERMDQEERRTRNELEFELWRESPDPRPLVNAKPSPDGSRVIFQALHVIDGVVWRVEERLESTPTRVSSGSRRPPFIPTTGDMK